MHISCLLGVGTLSALVLLVDAAAFLPPRHGRYFPREAIPLSSSMSSNSASSSSAWSNSTLSSFTFTSSISSDATSSSSILSSTIISTPAAGTTSSSMPSDSTSSASTTSPGQPVGSQQPQKLISVPSSPGPSDSIASYLASSSSMQTNPLTTTTPFYAYNGPSSTLPGSAPTNSALLHAAPSHAIVPPGAPYGSRPAMFNGPNSAPSNSLPSSLAPSLVAPYKSTTPIRMFAGPSLALSTGASVTAPLIPAPSVTAPSNTLFNLSPSNLTFLSSAPTYSSSSNPATGPITRASNRILVNTAPSNLPQPNLLLSNSALLYSGSAPPITTANPALSNGTFANASTTSGGCFDWLMHPLPCNCPGAYSSGGYSSLIQITSTYLNTNVNPPVQTTQVLTETVGPPAIVPGQDTCNLGCLIGASEVQILYWPVTTAAPNLSIAAAAPTTPYTYVSDGFTFTSPSVYVAYRGLKASAAYDPFGEPLGSQSHDVTVGYPPDALSTSHCDLAYTMSAQQYQPINYTELQYPPANSVLTDCPHASGQPDVGGVIYNPSASNEAGNPFFSIPGALNWVDPAWSTCIPVKYGVYDPPKALSEAGQMVAPTPVAASAIPMGDPAAPGSSPQPPVGPTTQKPGPEPAIAGPGVVIPAANLLPGTPASTSLVAQAGFQDPGASTNNLAVPAATFGLAGLGPLGPAKPPNFHGVGSALAPAPVTADPALANPVASNGPSPQGSPGGVTPPSPAPVVNTPSYNSIVMATPNSVIAAANPAPQPGNSPVVNPPVINAPVAGSPAGNAPSVNVPPANAPPANAPPANAPPANAPPANAPPANAPPANAPPANAPPANAPPANAPPANAPVSNPVVVASPNPVVVAGSTAAPAPNGGIVIASSTYAPGSQPTIGGKVISVGTNNIVQDGSTQNVPTQTEPTPVLVGGNSIESAAQGGVVIASSTYTPGQEALIAGTPISVGASNVVVASSTYPLPAAVPAAAAPTPVLVGGNSIANAPGGGVVIASSTYQPGVQAQISGTPISVGTGHIAVDSSTYALPSAPSATPVLVGGQPIAKAPNGGVIIVSSTYQPGAVAQVAGTPISVGTDNVVVDSQSYALPTAAAQTPAPAPTQAPAQTPVLVGGQSIVKAAGGGVVIGSSTIAPGAQATVSGTVVTAGTNNVVVGGNNYALPDTPGAPLQQQQSPNQPQTPALVGGQSVARASDGVVVVGGSTIAPGQQVTISGQVVSAGPTNVAIGGNTYTLPASAGAVLQTPAPPSPAQPTPALIGGQTVARASNGGIVIGSSTVAPGSQATISGQVISAGPSSVAIDGSTYALPTSAGAVLQTPAPVQQVPVEVGGNSIARAPNGGIVIGSSTLAPGSEATISGQVVSAGATNVAIGSSTYDLGSTAGAVLQTPAPVSPSNAPVLVAGQTVARAPNGGLMVGTSTLAPGAEATISGHTFSAAGAGATNIAIDGNNYPLPTTPGALLETPAPTTPSPNHEAITLANGAVISAGGPAAVISGVTASVLGDDSGIVIGSKTIPLPPSAALTPTSNATYTVGDQTFTASPSGSPFSIDGTTLTPGGPPLTISGTVISLGTGALQIGSTIMPLPTAPSELFTVGGTTFAAAATGFAIAGTSLSPGGSALTISGTVVSLGTAGLQIGTSTIPLNAAELTAAAGGFISGIGIAPTGVYNGSYTNSTSNSTALSGPTPLTGIISPSQAGTATSTAKPKTAMAPRVGSDVWGLIMTAMAGWCIGIITFMI